MGLGFGLRDEAINLMLRFAIDSDLGIRTKRQNDNKKCKYGFHEGDFGGVIYDNRSKYRKLMGMFFGVIWNWFVAIFPLWESEWKWNIPRFLGSNFGG